MDISDWKISIVLQSGSLFAEPGSDGIQDGSVFSESHRHPGQQPLFEDSDEGEYHDAESEPGGNRDYDVDIGEAQISDDIPQIDGGNTANTSGESSGDGGRDNHSDPGEQTCESDDEEGVGGRGTCTDPSHLTTRRRSIVDPHGIAKAAKSKYMKSVVAMHLGLPAAKEGGQINASSSNDGDNEADSEVQEDTFNTSTPTLSRMPSEVTAGNRLSDVKYSQGERWSPIPGTSSGITRPGAKRKLEADFESVDMFAETNLIQAKLERDGSYLEPGANRKLPDLESVDMFADTMEEQDVEEKPDIETANSQYNGQASCEVGRGDEVEVPRNVARQPKKIYAKPIDYSVRRPIQYYSSTDSSDNSCAQGFVADQAKRAKEDQLPKPNRHFRWHPVIDRVSN